jgi:penicillin V acylase-like amidase (Ntn superfamily)
MVGRRRNIMLRFFNLDNAKVNKAVYFFLMFIAVFVTENLFSCTIFSLRKNDITVYGQNLDWTDPVTGYVLINKRGVLKSILHWKGHWPAAKGDIRKPVMWKSKYGSVTFTYLGRDFIEGGMNEVGLMVDEASFLASYPPDDARPGVSCGQWMQYQLDNFETVREVIDHLTDLRPDGEEWHYLIADRLGDACAIEYIDGKPTVYEGHHLEYPILTNTAYAHAMSHIPMDKAFGGEIDIAAGTDSYGRFVKAAALMEEFASMDTDTVDYAFHILSAVSNETTRRSVVYDSHNKRVLWKSENNNRRRWLDLSQVDFSEGTPTLMVDSDLGEEGIINDYLEEYDMEIMRELLFNKFKNTSQTTKDLLKSRGYTLKEALDRIIQHSVRHMIENSTHESKQLDHLMGAVDFTRQCPSS